MSAPFHPRPINTATLAVLDRSEASEARVKVELSEADRDAYRASLEGVTRTTAPGSWVSVTDQRTGSRVSIRAASCGLRCVCDMEVKA